MAFFFYFNVHFLKSSFSSQLSSIYWEVLFRTTLSNQDIPIPDWKPSTLQEHINIHWRKWNYYFCSYFVMDAVMSIRPVVLKQAGFLFGPYYGSVSTNDILISLNRDSPSIVSTLDSLTLSTFFSPQILTTTGSEVTPFITQFEFLTYTKCCFLGV